MTQIKFCGLTHEDDIQHATKHDADHVGLVVHAPKSHRNLEPAKARSLAQAVRGSVNTVLVTIPQQGDKVHDALTTVTPDILQIPHTQDPPVRIAEEHDARLWLALGLKATPEATVQAIQDALTVADRVVLDALKDGYGGHGDTLDWASVANILEHIPREDIVLAGGLTPQNVGEAVAAVGPGCVDVSSGIETDGVNDPERMRAFAQAARGEVSA